MPSKLRIEQPEAMHHLKNRGDRTEPPQTLPQTPEEKVQPRSPKGTTATLPGPAVAPPAQQTRPETFQGYMLRGDLAFQQSHYEGALAAYSKAYQLNSNNREVRRKLAVVLTLLGRAKEAQQYK